jgi:hypothetical protein
MRCSVTSYAELPCASEADEQQRDPERGFDFPSCLRGDRNSISPGLLTFNLFNSVGSSLS